MENYRLTTTQDMFLERVGITNSFNDDNEYRFTPFFVSDSTHSQAHFDANKWWKQARKLRATIQCLTKAWIKIG